MKLFWFCRKIKASVSSASCRFLVSQSKNRRSTFERNLFANHRILGEQNISSVLSKTKPFDVLLCKTFILCFVFCAFCFVFFFTKHGVIIRRHHFIGRSEQLIKLLLYPVCTECVRQKAPGGKRVSNPFFLAPSCVGVMTLPTASFRSPGLIKGTGRKERQAERGEHAGGACSPPMRKKKKKIEAGKTNKSELSPRDSANCFPSATNKRGPRLSEFM